MKDATRRAAAMRRALATHGQGWVGAPFLFLWIGVLLIPKASHAADPSSPNDPALKELLTRVPQERTQTPKEAFSKTLSLGKAAEFLDSVALQWHSKKGCVTCHTNVPYLIARPILESKTPVEAITRKLFESTSASLKASMDKGVKPPALDLIPTVAALALNDRSAGNTLQPATKMGLDLIWGLQREDGGWDWKNPYNHEPFEQDEYFGVALAAWAVAAAPEQYAATPAAEKGIAKLQHYFASRDAPTLFHRAFAVLASTYAIDFLNGAARKDFLRDIFALQKKDGGWSLFDLGPWKVPTPKFEGMPESDGLATGLMLLVALRLETNVADPKVAAGLQWLEKNQRESGWWFTPSIGKVRPTGLLANAGTAYAVLAWVEAVKRKALVAERRGEVFK